MTQRQIKFRAWDKEREKMVYESDVQKEPYCLMLTLDGKLQDIACERFDEEKKFEVMQFTDLLDKAGKQIYQGDIVNVLEWNNGKPKLTKNVEIEWCKTESSFNLYPKTNIGNNIHHFCEEDEYEIIGNVWSNPELLK